MLRLRGHAPAVGKSSGTHPMWTESEMSSAVQQLTPLIAEENFVALETAIQQIGLDFVLSDDLIDYCRINSQLAMLKFLTTLAAHNNQVIDVKKPATFDDTIVEILIAARDHQNAGNISEATKLYEEVLAVYPKHAVCNYNLGLIEQNAKDTRHALLRFQIAAESEPGVEEFWIALINSLIDLNAYSVAMDTITLAKKHSLREETVYVLTKRCDSKAKTGQCEFVISAPVNNEFHLKRKQKVHFAVVSPPYRENSYGIVVLHELCDSLNRLGHPTIMIFIMAQGLTISNNEALYGKKLTRVGLQNDIEFNEFMSNAITIYPEVITGNPLGSMRVIRYILNKEGFIGGNSMEVGAKDFLLSFSKVYHDNPHAYLFKVSSIIGTNSDIPIDPIERNIDLTYIGKGSMYGKCCVVPNTLEIDRVYPRSREELYYLFRRCRYLYTWDTISATHLDAVVCGVVVVYMNKRPLKSFKELNTLELGNAPFATGKLKKGKVEIKMRNNYATVSKEFINNYFESISSYPNRLTEVISLILSYFGEKCPTELISNSLRNNTGERAIYK